MLPIVFTRILSLTLFVSEDFQSSSPSTPLALTTSPEPSTRSWLSLPVSVNSASDPIDVANMRDVDLKEQILFASSTSALVAMSPQEQSAYNASKIPGTLLNLPLLGLISVRWLVTCKY